MAARIEILRELGLLPLWRLRARGQAGAAPPVQEALATETRAAASDGGAAPDRLQRIAALDWPGFAADVDGCTACGLCRTRNKSVPGVGDRRAQWLFVGEAPGAEEDAKGEPFVGQAGRLLDNMLAALGMRRGQNVYIANVLKCRPPGNRTPGPLEVEACRPYLDRQIALIGPRLIVALGKSAAATLLNVDASIASLRGRVHRYQGVPLIVTYHPAYLLRNLPDKAKAWEDLCLARETLRRLQDGNRTLPLQAGATGPM
jgi:DNA polymerase